MFLTKKLRMILASAIGMFLFAVISTSDPTLAQQGGRPPGKGGGGGGGETSVGNNLSWPVVWAEGVRLPAGLRGDGLAAPPFAFLTVPYPSAPEWYAQGVEGNVWQARSFPPLLTNPEIPPIHVDAIDWGDNLESKDWNLKSPVRVETVLYLSLPYPGVFTEEPTVSEPEAGVPYAYQMKSLGGTKASELFGTNGLLVPPILEGDGEAIPRATVYTQTARLTIQKIAELNSTTPTLEWVAEDGYWAIPGTTTPPYAPIIFNKAVHEGGDGQGSYSAEVNGSGKVIFGYNWQLNSGQNLGTGIYRLTFSLDQLPGVNTFFNDDTEIYLAEAEGGDEEPGQGGTAQVDPDNQLTYIDVRINATPGGGGGGGGKKGR